MSRCATSTSPARTPAAASASRRRKATLLIKVACEAAVGKRPHVSIFGTDYPTPDGTGVRDYIHVEDLATAHLNALDYLRAGGDSATLNCGYGHGYSVREVLDSVERVAGQPLTIVEEARAAPAIRRSLVARAERIRAVLGWRPRLDDLDTIVRTALCLGAAAPAAALVSGIRPDAPIRYAVALTRPRRMRAPCSWPRPKSLSGLMLLGLALIAVPLLVAIADCRAADPRRWPTRARSS